MAERRALVLAAHHFGLRTYRFLPVFWKEFWPRHDSPALPAILIAMASERFGRGTTPAAGMCGSPRRRCCATAWRKSRRAGSAIHTCSSSRGSTPATRVATNLPACVR